MALAGGGTSATAPVKLRCFSPSVPLRVGRVLQTRRPLRGPAAPITFASRASYLERPLIPATSSARPFRHLAFGFTAGPVFTHHVPGRAFSGCPLSRTSLRGVVWPLQLRRLAYRNSAAFPDPGAVASSRRRGVPTAAPKVEAASCRCSPVGLPQLAAAATLTSPSTAVPIVTADRHIA